MSNGKSVYPDTLAAGDSTRDIVTRSGWYTLLVLTLINSAHYLDRTIISIVIEPIREEFLLSDGQLGILTGLVYGITFALAGLPLGYLVDRVNRRNLLATLVIIWSCFTALGGLAQNFFQLALSRMGVGAAEAGGSPSSMSIISDTFPLKQRSTAMGAFFLSMALGAAMSALIGSYVATHFGWRAAFFIAGVPGILFALLLLFTVKEPRRGAMDPAPAHDAIPTPAPGMGETLRFLAGQKALLHLFVAMPLAVMAVSAISAWIVAFFMRTHAMELPQASVIAGLTFGVFAAGGSLLGGLLSDRFGGKEARHRVTFAGVIALLGVPVTVAGVLVGSAPVAIACWFGMAALSFATIPPAFGSLVSLAKPRMRGITLASIQVVTNLLGYGLAPFLVGIFSDLYGGPDSLRYALLTVISVSLIWSMVHFFLAARSFDQGVVRASEA